MNYLPLITIALGVTGVFKLRGLVKVVMCFVLYTAGVVMFILMNLNGN